MSKFFCRVVVMSLLCLVAVATSAFAEGAWVLWSQDISVDFDNLKKSDLNPPWDPIDASATEAGCRRRMKETIEKARQLFVGTWGNAAKFVEGEDYYSGTVPDNPNKRTGTSLRCLPDTVDPRGPRGK